MENKPLINQILDHKPKIGYEETVLFSHKPNRKELKWDEGKLDYTLLEPEFLQEMAKIMTKGAVNHPPIDGRSSWKLVEAEAYLKALLRHIQDYRMGEKLDKEMGTHHLAHVAVNAMFVYFLTNKEARQ